jgi:hypothetical protein
MKARLAAREGYMDLRRLSDFWTPEVVGTTP